MKKKDYLIITLLALLPILLVFILVPSDSMFGNSVDWINQHVVIPDYFRQLFLENHNLFPDFAPHINAGTNIFDLSYYGLLRPDVLISYLLPSISMTTIVIVYSIAMMSLGTSVCYIWLRKKNYNIPICALMAVLLALSTVFYHSHKQIMFVNYIPWLIMAFMAVDYFIKKHKTTPLIICVVLIILHSYFYSVSSLFMVFVYYLYQIQINEKWSKQLFINKNTFKIMGAIIIGIMICGVLLLPTMYVILANSKSVTSTTLSSILSLNTSLKGLLYDNYGCGFTMIAWVGLVLGVSNKKTRPLSIFLIIAFVVNLVAYIFNGTLYVRTKILIILIPLVLLVLANSLQELKTKPFKYYLIPLFFLPVLFQGNIWMFALLDITVVTIMLIIYVNVTNYSLLLLTIAPAITLYVNNAGDYLLTSDYLKTNNTERVDFIKSYNQDSNYRSDDLSYPVTNANRVYNMNNYKTTGYSSTYNSLYNEFAYDIMNNPISSVNRVSNLPNYNIFFQGLMAIKTVYTKEVVPIGYNVVAQNDQTMIATSDNVLPLAYFTNNLMSEDTFDNLEYPYTLDTIYNNAIVENGNSDYQSKIVKEDLNYQILQQKNVEITKEDDKTSFVTKRKADLSLSLDNDLTNKVLIISFDVENESNKDVTISINGVTNKLARATAPYPNGNDHFTYVLSSNDAIKELNIELSKGKFNISNVETYTMDYDVIKNRNSEVTPLINMENVDQEVLKGTISNDSDGYFITSLPYEKGYSVTVDGEDVDIEVVNKSFIGFPLKAGDHEISIEFHAPLKNIGLAMSGVGVLLVFVNIFIERKNTDEK